MKHNFKHEAEGYELEIEAHSFEDAFNRFVAVVKYPAHWLYDTEHPNHLSRLNEIEMRQLEELGYNDPPEPYSE